MTSFAEKRTVSNKRQGHPKHNMLRSLSGLAITLCLYQSVSANTGDHPPIALPYSTNIVSYNLRSPDKIEHTMRVILSHHGVRVESNTLLPEGEQGIYIQNFKDNTSWISHPKKQAFAVLPPEKKPHPEKNDDLSFEGPMGGIMSTRPCLGLPSEKKAVIGKDIYAGSEVVIWRCTYNGYEVTQYFSHEWSTVVKEAWPNSDVIEMRHLKVVDFPEIFFRPPEKYQEISLREFYSEPPELDVYSEITKTE